jgi:hypothetical protein
LFQAVELPFYVIAAIVATHALSLTGAALVWSLRIGIDALALVVVAQRLVQASVWRATAWLAMAAAALALPAAFADRGLRLIVAGCVLCVFLAIGWRVAKVRMDSRAFGLPSLIFGHPSPTEQSSTQ